MKTTPNENPPCINYMLRLPQLETSRNKNFTLLNLLHTDNSYLK